jgi:hypothetical protein
MAKAYYGKEISLLKFSKYAKELQPYKLDLRRIFREWAKLDINKPRLLGAGTDGEAWDISSGLVLKIHRDQEKYLDIIRLPADSYLLKIRPKIFTSGSFSKNLQWVLMEKLDTIDEYDIELDILIAELSYYTEKTIEITGIARPKIIGNHIYLNSKLERSFEKVILDFEINSDFPIEKIQIIKERYNLTDNWLNDFAKQIIYLHIADKADDLWLPNLGISRLIHNKGTFIFFDW